MKDLTTNDNEKGKDKEKKTPPKTTSRNNIHVEGERVVITALRLSSLPEEEQEKKIKELKRKINSVFSEINDYFPILKEGVDKVVKAKRIPFEEANQIIKQNTFIEKKDINGKTVFTIDNRLSDSQLEGLGLYLASQISDLRKYLEDASLELDIAQKIEELTQTENLLKVFGGNGDERMLVAKQLTEIETYCTIIKKQVYLQLKNIIEDAERLLSIIKKVLNQREADKRSAMMMGNKFTS